MPNIFKREIIQITGFYLIVLTPYEDGGHILDLVGNPEANIAWEEEKISKKVVRHHEHASK